MLILTRRTGETLMVGDNVVCHIRELSRLLNTLRGMYF